MNRRSFLRGAVVLAPAVILTPGLLMPVRPIAYVPKWEFVVVRGITFWMKAPDRATRERMVRAAEDVILYPYPGRGIA
jgi:hypothetical protein